MTRLSRSFKAERGDERIEIIDDALIEAIAPVVIDCFNSICLIFLKLFERVYAPLTAGVLSPFTADARIDQQKVVPMNLPKRWKKAASPPATVVS